MLRHVYPSRQTVACATKATVSTGLQLQSSLSCNHCSHFTGSIFRIQQLPARYVILLAAVAHFAAILHQAPVHI